MDRLLNLSELDLDYSSLSDHLKDLTHLAAKVAGTDISLVNLIDSFTQWSVANYGLDVEQMPREQSVCQYTIMDDDQFEVHDLSVDTRFKDNFYVKDPLALRYYFGLPLKSKEGFNLGALCVMDTKLKVLNPEKIELLKIIATEVANRIKSFGILNMLKQKLDASDTSKKKVAHDIRGPLAGIIGLSEILVEQGKSTSIDDILEFVKLIHKSSRSILDLADEILTEDQEVKLVAPSEFNLSVFREKLIRLYLPQAQSKSINFQVIVSQGTQSIPFPKNKLLQIAGNLISNAIKFTPEGGKVQVALDLNVHSDKNILAITVQDSGYGMTEDTIRQILKGESSSSDGTSGEIGYGFGLSLVKHLIDSLNGTLEIKSTPDNGAIFKVLLPQKNT